MAIYHKYYIEKKKSEIIESLEKVNKTENDIYICYKR